MPRFFVSTIRQAYRRRSWIAGGITIPKVRNLLKIALAYVTKSELVNAAPPILKIDISPTCSLKCPNCLHADPKGRSLPLLEAQRFGKHDRMDVDQFTSIIDQVRNRIFAVSLFYYGDPYSHPNVDEFCRIARAAKVNVHVTSHFSYSFSDARIEQIARSGLTHLTVAVDGATQQNYEVTRVNGRLDWVLSNLRRLAAYRRENRLRWPNIEVQHIQHVHHAPGEVNRVRKIVSDFGIDQFTTYPGMQFTPNGGLTNITLQDLSRFEVRDPFAPAKMPRCHWPYLSMLIRFNGDVIPCCFHREARQHTGLEGRAIVGNVFQETVMGVWNNARYRANRQLVADPTAVDKKPALRDSFCYGCSMLTDIERIEPI